MTSRFRGGADHRDAIGDPARADADDVGLFLGEHVPVARVEARDAEALPGRRESGGIVVRDGDDFEELRVVERGIKPVAVTPAAGGADDAGPVFAAHVAETLAI